MHRILIGLLLTATSAFADVPALDFPLVDAPFTWHDKSAYAFPSMRQSLAVSTDFYEGMHALIGGDEWPQDRWRRWTIAGFDVLTIWTPLGSTWVHEEWHRAVMANRGIASFDDVNTFPIGSGLIAVSHVTDEDLVRLKRDHPADQVRLSSAGMESQTAQNLLIESHHFFDDVKTNDTFLLLLNDFSVTNYLWTCGGTSADRETDRQNIDDGGNVGKRDFTGLDCTAWAYDLFRPDEPYGARGLHPSGTGLNRYIHYSDLSGHEQSFLRRQVLLSLFNFGDPFLIRRSHFQMQWEGESADWNFRTSHYLTSFGYTVDANFFFRQNQKRFALQLHNGFNDKTYFPGVTLTWLDHPLSDRLHLTTSATLWNQPRGQRFDSPGGALLAHASASLNYQWKNGIEPYVGLEGKTPGWIAGNVYTDRNLTLWTGFRLQL